MKEKKIRNDLIRTLYKKGLGGILGKRFGIKRQRIHQIISQKPIGRWRALWQLIRKHLTYKC